MKSTTALFGIWMLFGNTTVAFADLNQYRLRTVEWLVDNADVIAVFQLSPSDPPKLLHTYKGETAQIEFPLSPSAFDGYYYFERPAEGPIRLYFIRGTNELLEEIEIGRRVPRDSPKLMDVYYGTTQYGKVLLSEQMLLQTVLARLAAKPTPIIKPNVRVAHARKSGVNAPSDFPLESGGETYVLIVPFTSERRDHFLNALKNGKALEKIRAIWGLHYFDDPSSKQAIIEATRLTSVEPTYLFNSDGRVEIGQEDVVRAAKEALEWLPRK